MKWKSILEDCHFYRTVCMLFRTFKWPKEICNGNFVRLVAFNVSNLFYFVSFFYINVMKIWMHYFQKCALFLLYVPIVSEIVSCYRLVSGANNNDVHVPMWLAVLSLNELRSEPRGPRRSSCSTGIKYFFYYWKCNSHGRLYKSKTHCCLWETVSCLHPF